MDFERVSTYSSIGLEGAVVLLLVVCSWKLYKMKIHTRSKSCGFMSETLNHGGSISNLDFSEPQEMQGRDDRAYKNNIAVIL
jgi:hypothetical protein